MLGFQAILRCLLLRTFYLQNVQQFLGFSFSFFTCMWCACACACVRVCFGCIQVRVHVHVCTSMLNPKLMSVIFISPSLLYFLRVFLSPGFTNSSQFKCQLAPRIPSLPPEFWSYEDLHIAWLIVWIQNVVVTPGQQALYPLSHLPSSCFLFCMWHLSIHSDSRAPLWLVLGLVITF